MNINRLIIVPIAIFCFSASLFSEAQCMEKVNDEKIENHQTTLVPAGGIMAFSGEVPPSGWLLCDGKQVSSLEYPELYTIIGEKYAPEDEKSFLVKRNMAAKFEKTFYLPDLKGRVIVGVDGGSGRVTSNNTLGAQVLKYIINIGNNNPLESKKYVERINLLEKKISEIEIYQNKSVTVFISSQTALNQALITFKNVFTPHYDHYMITFNNILPSINQEYLAYQLGTVGGNVWITTGYNSVNTTTFSNGNSIPVFFSKCDGGGYLSSNNYTQKISGNSLFGGLCGTMHIYNPNNANVYTNSTFMSNYCIDNEGTIASCQGSSSVPNNNHDSIRFNLGGNAFFVNGTIRIYGIRKD